MRTPLPPLPRSSVPVASVPIWLARIELVSASSSSMPSSPLAAMTLPARGPVPPIVLLLALTRSMPSPPLGRAASAASRPITLPTISLPADAPAVTRMPHAVVVVRRDQVPGTRAAAADRVEAGGEDVDAVAGVRHAERAGEVRADPVALDPVVHGGVEVDVVVDVDARVVVARDHVRLARGLPADRVAVRAVDLDADVVRQRRVRRDRRSDPVAQDAVRVAAEDDPRVVSADDVSGAGLGAADQRGGRAGRDGDAVAAVAEVLRAGHVGADQVALDPVSGPVAGLDLARRWRCPTSGSPHPWRRCRRGSPHR